MSFGQTVRQLRMAKGLSLRDLAPRVGVGFSYLSRVENEALNYGDYPTESLIHRLADALDADEFELLVLAQKVPPGVRRRFLERPDAFRKLAELDDEALDMVLVQLERASENHGRRRRMTT